MTAPPRPARRNHAVTTAPSPLDRLLRWGFRRYLLGGFPFRRGFLTKHFHAVRLLEPIPELPAGKRVFFLNHPGWWDPLAAAALARRLAPDRAPFAPIDADAMRKYPVVGRLGLFGVERNTPAGARAFLRAASAVLDDPAADLWLTPQGTFVDPDERPVSFEPGLGHLVARESELWAVPVAVRYEFWTERSPELLLAVGEPVRRGELIADDPGGVRRAAAGGHPGAAGACSRSLAERLTVTMDRLATAARRRDAAAFRTIHAGAAGVSAGYDAVRRASAAVRGRRYDAGHGPG